MPNEKREEHASFFAVLVHLLECVPCDRHGSEGEPVTVVTVARGHRIEPLAFSSKDARKLATGLLVSLATYEDPFARELLDNHFGVSDEGEFTWPTTPR